MAASKPFMKFWVLIFNLSIYDGNYELETKYQSPIADDAISDYNYKLLDTLAINGDNLLHDLLLK
jgi:hypothetical protein